MKRFLTISLIIAGLVNFAQSPVFNINRDNLFLLNPASVTHNYSMQLNSDNIFESFDNDKKFFVSNLSFQYLFWNNISIGGNIQYDYQKAANKIKAASVLSAYHYHINRDFYISGGVSLGFNSIDVSSDYSEWRYSAEKIFIGKNNFNVYSLNAGINLFHDYDELGFSISDISLSEFPNKDNKKILPPKLNAYIRKYLINRRLLTSLITRLQDKIQIDALLNQYVNLSYVGLNVDYFYRLMEFGVTFRQFFGNNIAYGVSVGIRYNFSIRYTFSVMPQENRGAALFNQISASYKFGEHDRQKLSGLFL